jgi:hypothetical protein
LWNIDYNAANAIFLGYLLLGPKYDELCDNIRNDNIQKNIDGYSIRQTIGLFINKYENELKNVVSNKIVYAEVGDVKSMDLHTLTTAFELLPLKTKNEDHKIFLTSVISVFATKLFEDNHSDDYALKHRLLNKCAYFIISSTKEEIETNIRPFIDKFNDSRETADFLQEFILVEDRLNSYDGFWTVWNACYEKIVTICNKDKHYANEVLCNYLLAWPYWKEDAKEWHTLKEREKSFYGKVVADMRHHPAILYSIVKILTDIGSKYIDEGIIWISSIIATNNKLELGELEANTIYYLENVVRKYILTNRQKVKKNVQVKNQILVILNYLVEQGSTTGYMLREDIL